MARERYYVGQYGYFYSFSKAGIIAFLKEAIANDGSYHLSSCAEISSRPKGVHRSEGEGGSYWSSMTGPLGRYIEPLDWDTAMFDDALRSIEND